MKNILCFGDSNTWGADPEKGGRHPFSVRWTGIVRDALGPDYWLIEEGLGGRTTLFSDPLEGDKNGKNHLYVALWSHVPIDLVIICLGTNDLKARFSVPAVDIAEGIAQLCDVVRQSPTGPDWKPCPVLVLCPPPIMEVGAIGKMFAGGAAKSLELQDAFADMVKNRNLPHLYVKDYAESSPFDGIHMDAKSHKALGEALVPKIKEILG